MGTQDLCGPKTPVDLKFSGIQDPRESKILEDAAPSRARVMFSYRVFDKRHLYVEYNFSGAQNSQIHIFTYVMWKTNQDYF